jgi:hypothetical protein
MKKFGQKLGHFLVYFLIHILIAFTSRAKSWSPPQVVWPSEFRATVNVTVNESATLQFYNLSYSKRFNSEIRVIPQNGSLLTDHNTSRSFAITTESPPSCIESSSQWPIFNPNLSSFTVKGIDLITFPFPTQLWQGTVQGELFSYYCTADDQQMPVGFCGRDYDSIKKCIHWMNFLQINASNNNPWPIDFFNPPSFCPQ